MQLPKQMLKAIPKEYFDGSRGTLKLLWEEEWRALGITQVRSSRMRLRARDRTRPHRSTADCLARAWAGSTTRYMSLSRTSYSSSDR